MNPKEPGTTTGSSQRVDQWLWRARFFKTRTLADKIVRAGNIRLTRSDQTKRVKKSATLIQPGDILAFSKAEQVFIIEVRACAARRGPAKEAVTLYEDRSPAPPPQKTTSGTLNTAFAREKGAGRPTKKDRRALDALR